MPERVVHRFVKTPEFERIFELGFLCQTTAQAAG
jgi:hypothetical protein